MTNDIELRFGISSVEPVELEAMLHTFGVGNEFVELLSSNSLAMHSTSMWSEIIAYGKDIPLLLLPVLTYYLGQGRKVRVKKGGTEIELEGGGADELKRLIEIVRELDG